MTENLFTSLGFDFYKDLQEDDFDALISKLQNSLSPYDWCIMGGASVVHYVGKENRQVSPDIDFLINPTEQNLLTLKSLFPEIKTGLYGLTANHCNLEVDFLFASDKLLQEALNSKIRSLFIPVPYLIVNKFKTGRDKDLKDFQHLYQTK